MHRAAGVLAGVALAAIGAVVLGEYDLRGLTAIVGFPLFALAVTEVAVAVGRRLGPLLVVVAAAVGLSLVWALWISFNHFRREHPPVLSWLMVAVALAVSVLWGRSSRTPSQG